jgi:hypothetical protein
MQEETCTVVLTDICLHVFNKLFVIRLHIDKNRLNQLCTN